MQGKRDVSNLINFEIMLFPLTGIRSEVDINFASKIMCIQILIDFPK
jgi:hypothetical protein